MKQAQSFFAALGCLTSLTLLSSCASNLGDGDESGDGGTGGDAVGTGGDPGTGGVLGTGGDPGTGGDAGTGGAGTGGAGTGGDPGVVYSAGYQALLDVLSGVRIGRPDYSCASSDCHSGGHDHSAVPLRLVEDADLYTEITTHISAKCGNLKVVEPGDPANSALIRVLREGCDDVPAATIPRMPYDCVENEFENTCVAEEHIVTIEQWIASGAPQF